jgi:hypothetical protein
VTRVALALIALACAGAARATTLRAMDLAELALEASLIVHGRVVDVHPEWVRGGRQIDSVVTVEVETPLKGEPGQRFAFVSPGGQLGDYRSVVPGAPEFAVGAEVVLFLGSPGAAGLPSLVGMGQGALPVSSDESGRKRVRAPLLVPGMAEAHVPVRISLTLAELAEQLARIHASARGRR